MRLSKLSIFNRKIIHVKRNSGGAIVAILDWVPSEAHYPLSLRLL